ncbi:MAG: Mrp/NBP35 family ATP-binding protein [Lachnospiraceae bacterium]|nr:Mrp/NBP35 family ATP-binding protein [Lachnospiraceae bacterium]
MGNAEQENSAQEKPRSHREPPKPKFAPQGRPSEFDIETNPESDVKKVIAVVSGKGGVGKSSVTALCALMASRKGYKTAILDADITGPSIPKMFNVDSRDVSGGEHGLYPAESLTGVRIMSMNLLMEDTSRPVIWRSPVITGTLKQFWTEVCWGEVDYMFVDMPPGTGDVPLTVFQSFPVDGIIIVTTPQDLARMIVAKAVGMARMMNIPILGVIENMSYAVCPHCGEKIDLFGESGLEEYAAKEGLKILGKLPVDPALSKAADEGTMEYYEGAFPENLADIL